MPYQKTISVEELDHCSMVDDELDMFRSANKEVELTDETDWEWVEELAKKVRSKGV